MDTMEPVVYTWYLLEVWSLIFSQPKKDSW